MLVSHTRSFVVGILIVGGMVSFGVVYVMLFSSYVSVPSSDLPTDGDYASTVSDSAADVFGWVDAKVKASGSIPKVSNSVFSIPSSL